MNYDLSETTSFFNEPIFNVTPLVSFIEEEETNKKLLTKTPDMSLIQVDMSLIQDDMSLIQVDIKSSVSCMCVSRACFTPKLNFARKHNYNLRSKSQKM
jgi:hypothetical protein